MVFKVSILEQYNIGDKLCVINDIHYNINIMSCRGYDYKVINVSYIKLSLT